MAGHNWPDRDFSCETSATWVAGVQTSLLGLAIAAILALLAALLGPYFVDWNQYRQTFEAEATRLVGLPVRVTGQIDARLLPSPSLILSGIEIGKRGDDQLLRARALGIEFGLGSLVRGELRAVDMRVIAPEFAAGIDREGRVALPNMAVGFNLGALSVERLRIEDARLVLTDASSGARSVLDKLWFGGEMRSLAGPFKGEGAFVWSGGLYGYRVAAARPDESGSRIRFSIDPSDRPLVIEGEGNLAIERGVPRFEGSVTLARPVGAVLAGGATLLNEPWRVTARVKANSSSALLEQVEFQYGPDERPLKLAGTAELKFGRDPRLEGVVSARQLDLDRFAGAPDGTRRDPLAALQILAGMFGALRPPLPVQLGVGIDSVTLGGGSIQNLRGDLASEGAAVTLSALEFRAPGFTQVQASGQLDMQDGSFSGPVDVSSVDPRALLGWLEGRAEVSGGAAKPMRARGEVTFGNATIAVERLKAELDRKPVEGRLAYSFARDDRKARLDAELKAAELDIDGMLDFAASAFSGVGIERPGEMSLALDIGRGQFAGLEAKQANARLTYDATGLAIERLSVGDFGGLAVDAKGRIDTTAPSPRGSVTLDLAGPDLSGVAALAAKFAPRSADIAGRLAAKLGPAKLRVSLNVDAAAEQGQSVAKLVVTGNAGGLSVDASNQVTGNLAEAAKARIDLRGRIGAEDATALFRLAGLDGVVAPDRLAGTIHFAAQGPFDGDLTVDTRLQAGSLQARSSGTMRLSARDGVQGKLDLAVTGADLRGLRPAGTGEEALPATFSARATLAGQDVKLDGVMADIAGIPVKGRLGFALNRPMNIEGELETGTLDGAALIAAAIGMTVPRDRASWPAEPFTQGLISDVSGRIVLRIARADMAADIVATGVRADLRLVPSQIALENIEGDLLGGRLVGELSLRKAPDGLTARGRIALKDADASRAIAGEGSSPVAGRIGLDIEFEGTGLSPRALIGSLNGAGTIMLEGGRIAGLDARAFGAAMHAVDQGMTLEASRIREVVTPVLNTGPLVVPSADATITLSAGQARLGTLVARAEGADLSISGNYDLSDRSVDARIVLAGPTAITSAGRPELAIALKGPAASPKRTLDVSALAGWLALRSVEQQSRRLEAIERGVSLPVPDAAPWMQSVQPPSSSTGTATDQPPVRARPRPATALPDVKTAPREQAAPLPPPIDIRPAAGDRKPAPPRLESELNRPRLPARPPQIFFEPRNPAASDQ